jgi:hypothetical protein
VVIPISFNGCRQETKPSRATGIRRRQLGFLLSHPTVISIIDAGMANAPFRVLVREPSGSRSVPVGGTAVNIGCAAINNKTAAAAPGVE